MKKKIKSKKTVFASRKNSKPSKKTEKPSGKIIPLGDRVILKPLSPEEMSTTASGIIIPDTVSKEKPEQGTIVAVGEGKMENGRRTPLSVKVGDRVVFSRYGYDEVKVEGEEYYILKEENILAILN